MIGANELFLGLKKRLSDNWPIYYAWAWNLIDKWTIVFGGGGGGGVRGSKSNWSIPNANFHCNIRLALF